MIAVAPIQQLLVVALSLFSVLIALSNVRFLESLGGRRRRKNFSSITVLIPARNEAERIRSCLDALTVQKHKALGVIVLDDHSSDGTSDVVKSFTEKDPRLRLLQGESLPPNWVGKHWACHQLAEAATTDYLLFVDADTLLSEDTIATALADSQANDADLLTVIPRRVAECFIERVMFPFIDWAVLCWLPLKTAHRRRNPYLSATYGQFMLFRRTAYNAIGGHKAVYDNVVDDFELGRMIKRNGFRWVLLDGKDHVESQAYQGDVDAFRGISRSIFPALDYHLSIFVIFAVLLTLLALTPSYTLASGLFIGDGNRLFMIMSTVSLGMLSLSWLISCMKFNHSSLTVLIHPFIIALMLTAGLHSVVTNVGGFSSWKDRTLPDRKIKL